MFEGIRNTLNKGITTGVDFFKTGLEKGGDLLEKVPLIGKAVTQKREDKALIDSMGDRDITDRTRAFATDYQDVTSGDKSFGLFGGLMDGAGSVLGKAWNIVTPWQTKSEKILKEKLEGDKDFEKFMEVQEEAVNTISLEVESMVQQGQFKTQEEAEAYFNTRINERLDQFVRDRELSVNEENINESTPLWHTYIQGREEVDEDLQRNKYVQFQEKVIRDIDEEIRNEFTFNESDIHITKNIDIFQKMLDKTRENLSEIDMMKFESLAQLGFDSDEAQKVNRNLTLFREAKKEFARSVFEYTKLESLTNIDKDINDILREATDHTIDNLDEKYKAVLYQQGSIVGATRVATRLGKAWEVAGDVNASNSWKEKAKLSGKLFVSQLGLMTEGFGTGFREVYDVGRQTLSDTFIGETFGSEGLDMTRFENARDRKIFGDAYEFEILNRGWAGRGAAHLFYNLDDIGELAVQLAATRGSLAYGSSGRMVNNLSKPAAKVADFLRQSSANGQAVNFTLNSGKAVRFGPMNLYQRAAANPVLASLGKRFGPNAADDVLSGFFLINPLIDRNTRQASTEANDLMNFWFDVIGGRALGYLGTGAGAIGSKGAKTVGLSGISQKLDSGKLPQDYYAGGVNVMDSIVYGGDFVRASEELAKRLSTGGNAVDPGLASRLIKNQMVMAGQISVPITNTKQLYDSFAEYAEAGYPGTMMNNNGDIMFRETPDAYFEKFMTENKERDMYSFAIKEGNDVDLQVATSMFGKKIEFFKENFSEGKKIGNFQFDRVTPEAQASFLEDIATLQKTYNEALSVGDRANILAAYDGLMKRMNEAFIEHVDTGTRINIYNTATKEIFSIEPRRLGELRGTTSYEEALNNGIVLKEGKSIGETSVTSGTYRILEGQVSAARKENLKSLLLPEHIEGNKGPLRKGFKNDTLPLLQNTLDALGLENSRIKITPEESDEKNIMDYIVRLGENEDNFINIASGIYKGEAVHYPIPGKKFLDIYNGPVDIKDANFMIRAINLAIELGGDSSNIEAKLKDAINLMDTTTNNHKVLDLDFEKMYDNILRDFIEEGSLDQKLIPEGEELKQIISTMHDAYKIDDALSLFFYKTMILKLGRDPQTFKELRDFIAKEGKTVSDIQSFNSIFLGNITRRELLKDMKKNNTFTVSGLDEHVNDVLASDIARNTLDLENVQVKIQELQDVINYRAMGVQEKELKAEQLAGYRRIEKQKMETIERLQSPDFISKISENFYQESAINYINREVSRKVIKMDNTGALPGKIYEGTIDMTDILGDTPKEITTQKKIIQKKEKEINTKLKKSAREMLSKDEYNKIKDNPEAVRKMFGDSCSI